MRTFFFPSPSPSSFLSADSASLQPLPVAVGEKGDGNGEGKPLESSRQRMRRESGKEKTLAFSLSSLSSSLLPFHLSWLLLPSPPLPNHFPISPPPRSPLFRHHTISHKKPRRPHHLSPFFSPFPPEPISLRDGGGRAAQREPPQGALRREAIQVKFKF